MGHGGWVGAGEDGFFHFLSLPWWEQADHGVEDSSSARTVNSEAVGRARFSQNALGPEPEVPTSSLALGSLNHAPGTTGPEPRTVPPTLPPLHP